MYNKSEEFIALLKGVGEVKKGRFRMLTRSEKQIMELLWSIDEPLTCLEIIDRCEDKRWKDSYIHIMIRSLLEKGMIKVNGVELVCKNYARKFGPALTKDEYIVKTLMNEKVWTNDKMPPLFAAFVKNEASVEVLDQFDQMIKERKQELSKD